MDKTLLTLLLTVCLTLGCQAQPQKTVVFEPVRYEDGTAVNEAEAGLAPLLEADSLRTETVIEGSDTLLIYKHVSAFVKLSLEGLPRTGHIDKIDLVPTYGESGAPLLTLGEDMDIPLSGKLDFWTALKPQSLSALAVIVHTGGGYLSARIPESELEAGTVYRWEAPCFGSDAPRTGLKATPLPQTPLSIGSGEYSGITHISGNRYAVVDDNLKGGGILFFSIPIGPDGSVGTVVTQAAEGTVAAEGKARDCEGIAYVPSTGTLYVSAETQDIRGYDLTGNETGKSFRIPKDLSTSNIVSNFGFEAFTYNDTTKLFWTTTEAPLKSETVLPRLLRLQSFNADGEPAERFFYQTGEPQKTAEGTTAYVFGVPALTALDDGRLLVLEREVYVPKGGFWDKLTTSFTKIDLYLVDPVHDKAGILRKSLLCSFRTGALDLANFEGMCLGPALPDGRRCLLLVADSQQGSGGLTQEYVKVILLK